MRAPSSPPAFVAPQATSTSLARRSALAVAVYSNGAATPTHPAVIVVDDDVAIVEVVRDALFDEGIACESCPYGHRAHACIRAKQPQVVLLDIQMPEVNGIQLFQQ